MPAGQHYQQHHQPWPQEQQYRPHKHKHIPTVLDKSLHMNLTKRTTVAFLRDMNRQAHKNNRGIVPSVPDQIFDLIANCDSDLQDRLTADGVQFYDVAQFEARLDQLRPAGMEQPAEWQRVQLRSKRCPSASQLSKHIVKIKMALLCLVDRNYGDVVPTSLIAYAQQVQRMAVTINERGKHLVTALVHQIVETIEATMPHDAAPYLFKRDTFVGIDTLDDLARLEHDLNRLAESMFPARTLAPTLLTVPHGPPKEATPAQTPIVQIPTAPPTITLVTPTEQDVRREQNKAKHRARAEAIAKQEPPSKHNDHQCGYCAEEAANGRECGCSSYDHYNQLCPHKLSRADRAQLSCTDCASHADWKPDRRKRSSIGHLAGSIRCSLRVGERKPAIPNGK